MLKSRAVVQDFEGFRSKKSGFIIKKLAVITENYTDTVSSLPPAAINTLSLSEEKNHRWFAKFLQGLAWENGDYLYFYLEHFLKNIGLRFPLLNLENLPCPKI